MRLEERKTTVTEKNTSSNKGGVFCTPEIREKNQQNLFKVGMFEGTKSEFVCAGGNTWALGCTHCMFTHLATPGGQVKLLVM